MEARGPAPEPEPGVDFLELIEALTATVGSDHVLIDPDLRTGYEVDWTGRYAGSCDVVVRPSSTEEVSAVVAACNRAGAVVTTQGGNTGLVGGSVPQRRGRDTGTSTSTSTGPQRVADRAPLEPPVVVLSLRRLDRLGPVDNASMQVTAAAGVTLARWREHARSAGLDTPVDFAARDVATVGGAVATNAGGSRVLRFGTMRQQVVGIEAVLADGTVVGSLSGLPKETAGLHWPSVFAGSEGTLAVITAVRLRLVPWYRETITALVAVESLDAATTLLVELRRSVPSVDAVELIGPEAMRLVSAHLAQTPPVALPGSGPAAESGAYLMIDCADHTDPSDGLLAALERSSGIVDVAITNDAPQREKLIAFRDRITEAIAAASAEIGAPTFKLDVAVPIDRLTELSDVAHAAAADDGCRLIPFGHLAEGNVHLNHLGANQPDQIADTVLGAVARLGGTISAEHGIGVSKTRWLHLIRTPDEIRAQAAIRSALDPTGMFNPGVLTPDGQVPKPKPRSGAVSNGR